MKRPKLGSQRHGHAPRMGPVAFNDDAGVDGDLLRKRYLEARRKGGGGGRALERIVEEEEEEDVGGKDGRGGDLDRIVEVGF